MKKTILSLLFITSLVFAARAQRVPPQAQGHVKTPEQRAMHITKVLRVKLKLTVRQAKLIHRMYLSQAIEMDSIRNNSSNNRRADMQQKRTVKKTTDQEIMGVLNAGQQQQFVQYKKMVKQKRMNKKGRNAAPASAPGDNDTQG